MSNHLKFYIDGQWVSPVVPATLDVINPATEKAYTQISIGSKADVDKAVIAAKTAFTTFSKTSHNSRMALLMNILELYKERFEDIAKAVSDEMGAPMAFARDAQALVGRVHLGAL